MLHRLKEVLADRILDTALLPETYGFTIFVFGNPFKLLKSLPLTGFDFVLVATNFVTFVGIMRTLRNADLTAFLFGLGLLWMTTPTS